MNFVINPARFCFWDSTTGRPLSATERPVVVYGSPFNFQFTLSDASVNANAIYSLAIDDDFDFTNDNVMAYSVADSVGNGIVSFVDVNTKTSKFHDLILGKQFSRVFIQITETIGTASRVLCADWIMAGGVVLDGEGDPETLQPVLDQARVYSANAILAASDARAWTEGNAEVIELLGGTFSAKGWADEAEQAAAAAATAAERIPAATTAANNKLLSVSNGTYTFTDAPSLVSVTVQGNNLFNSTGLTIYSGTVCIYGSETNRVLLGDGSLTLSGGLGLTVYGPNMDTTTVKGGTITTDKVSNGTFSLPFAVPVVSTSSSYLVLERDKSYNWDLRSFNGINMLETEGSLAYGVNDFTWAVDILLGGTGSVQYGLTFDAAGSDALTANKLNRCIVRWDGTAARLYCYKTEDLP